VRLGLFRDGCGGTIRRWFGFVPHTVIKVDQRPEMRRWRLSRRKAFELDRVRDATLAEEGYRVIRFTWRRLVDEPDEVARQLGALIATARSSAP
jgi:Protein of unknown function (DUF559)